MKYDFELDEVQMDEFLKKYNLEEKFNSSCCQEEFDEECYEDYTEYAWYGLVPYR